MSEAVREGYQDDLGYEIFNGKVVSMAPANTGHVTVSGNIYRILWGFLRGKKCRAFADGLMVHFSKKDKFVPDVMVVCQPEIIKADGVYGAPDLVVEILSPSTTFRDRGYKRDIYEKNGVREYWIVDIKGRTVEVYSLADDGYVLDQAYVQNTPDNMAVLTEEEQQKLLQTVCSCIFPDLEINLADVFEDV